MLMLVDVKNATQAFEKNVVARLVDGELWYFGSYKTKKDAETVVKTIGEDALVVFRKENK